MVNKALFSSLVRVYEAEIESVLDCAKKPRERNRINPARRLLVVPTSIYVFSCIVQSASQMHDPVVILSDVHHVLIGQ